MSAILASGLFALAATQTIAIVGDYGTDSVAEGQVATLIKSWNPDFVVTTGDNNYDIGSATTIDKNIGKYYHEFIYNYAGTYGAGSATQRFIPSLGNHDWGNAANNPSGANPYLAYFTLPGNERYYSFRRGNVEFFVLDSDANEPDGVNSNSAQAQWCQTAMGASTASVKIPVFHHPPYSSSVHGSSTYMRWPFAAWGATAVVTGHDHTYERLKSGNVYYFVDGLGGRPIYTFGTPLPESQFRYNANYGAMRLTVTAKNAKFEFVNIVGVVVDTLTLRLVPVSTGPGG